MDSNKLPNAETPCRQSRHKGGVGASAYEVEGAQPTPALITHEQAREAYNKLHDHVYGNGRVPTLSVPPQPTDVDIVLCNYIEQQSNLERAVVSDIVKKMQGRIAELRKMHSQCQSTTMALMLVSKTQELLDQIAELSKEYGL